MPDLVGRTRAQVFQIMRDDGLYFQTRGPASATGTWVTVTAQFPRPGVLVAWHHEATLAVTASASNAHAPVRMPDLVGRTRAQVFQIMRDDGLYFQTRGPASATGTWVTVTAQFPRPGVLVAWHHEATLAVTTQSARGPRPVPRLTGLTKSQLFATMRAAQLYFNPVGPGSTNGSWAVVLAQSPPAGTPIAWHGVVTVRVSARRRVVVKKTAPVTPSVGATVAVGGSVVNGANYKIGVATWYSWIPGQCATWYLPKGTRITVRDLTTNKTITCVITDREDHLGNHVVDLSESGFAQLAPLWTGVISVKITW